MFIFTSWLHTFSQKSIYKQCKWKKRSHVYNFRSREEQSFEAKPEAREVQGEKVEESKERRERDGSRQTETDRETDTRARHEERDKSTLSTE